MKSWALQFADPDTGRAAFEESIAICESGAISGTLAPSLARVAPLRLQAGDIIGALEALRTSTAHCRDTGERLNVVTILDVLKVVLTNLGEMEPAVVAFGVIRAETFGPLSLVSGLELERNEQHLLIARAALGDAAYEAALAHGASLSDEDALEYALRELDRVLADHMDN